MSALAIRSFEEFTVENCDGLSAALAEDFSVQSIVGYASQNGFKASERDWQRYFGDFLPHSHLSLRVANDDGKIVELDVGEIEAVSGGSVSLIAAAVAFVVVAAQALAAVVNVAAAANIAWTVNVAWTYDGGGGGGSS